MNFSEDFKNNLIENINDFMKDDDVLLDIDRLSRFEKLLSIYNTINNIEVQNKQLRIFEQSRDAMKNIDFSDIKDMVDNIMRK